MVARTLPPSGDDLGLLMPFGQQTVGLNHLYSTVGWCLVVISRPYVKAIPALPFFFLQDKLPEGAIHIEFIQA
ncbi:hypothetical protein D9613_011791 [Agrocybe pediades]|uniref:Uncharacterized protein n=1 Tax=Agrocybe pediades TaxID=84607 RepID=A0A8H4QKM9_9AGAR|nr:hypothetical protein D9613_011791 [Agrocybe pediades]